MSLIEALASIPDARAYNSRHALVDILFVALAAKLCGADDCTAMATFAADHIDFLREIVPLENGPPSHNTFSAVLRTLDPVAFDAVLRQFMAAFGQQAQANTRHQLAVDGKSIRRAYDKGCAHMPPLMVTVYDCDTLMSLTQVQGEKGGEAKAAIDALSLLSLKGSLVSGDALHCHRAFTKAVRQRGGHYLITLKGNQSNLSKQAAAALDKAALNPRTKVAETKEKSHGRLETRRAFVTPFTQTPGKNALVDLRAVGRIESTRTIGGKTTVDVRTFVMSRPVPAHQLLIDARKQWSIENKLHWQLDVLMREDSARTRKDNGPANLATLNRLALNVFRNDPQKIPLSHKRLKASWDFQTFLRALTYMR